MPLPRKWQGKPLNQTRVLKGGRADPNRPRHKSGNPACRWCGSACHGRRTSFCKAKCSHEWRLRTSTSYLRRCVFKKSKGICRSCGLDTKIFAKHARKLPRNEQREWATKMGLPKNRRPTNLMAWSDCDHIIPVVEGGGLAGISQCQTLCLDCHRKKSANEARARARCGEALLRHHHRPTE